MKRVIYLSGYTDEIVGPLEEYLNKGAETLDVVSHFIAEQRPEAVNMRPVTIALLIVDDRALEEGQA